LSYSLKWKNYGYLRRRKMLNDGKIGRPKEEPQKDKNS